jgi:hypothetical protein
MSKPIIRPWIYGLAPLALLVSTVLQAAEESPLTLRWQDEMLSIRGPNLPGGDLQVHYLEAFCRPGSTRQDWKETVIPHRTRLIEASADGRLIRLRSELADGVTVDHELRAGSDEVDFRLVATNPGKQESQAHWAQPCIRVDRFTGTKAVNGSETYLPFCFLFVNDKLATMPVEPWAHSARYTPGQVWCPNHVSREDVNPRPLSSVVPSSGLIGCYSADRKHLMATAWEPYQELFQGVIVCLHSDFRIGGLKPGESKSIRGKIYLIPADMDALLARYRRDFPEHQKPVQSAHDVSRPRKLIEFGWDEPDTGFLRMNQKTVEHMPFDGCVFHVSASGKTKGTENFTWLCWSKRQFTDAELSAAFEDLRSISWKRFRSNFLRFNVTPADLDWFDDHEAVLANASLAARLAREGHCQGILLDTEQYERALFNYNVQRDTARKSWQDYARQACRRGRELITALQRGYPDLTVLVTFGPSLLWKQSNKGTKPLAECRYGLLVPFFDGLIEGVEGKTRIVDGYELSYGYKTREQFSVAYEAIATDAAGLMADPAGYQRVVSPGFGLWLDHDWRKRGWKTDKPEANYFSPDQFQVAVRAALERADEYVWVYTETPRWWTNDGKPRALPEVYVRAIRQARLGLCPD